MEISQRVLELPASDGADEHTITDITRQVQKVISGMMLSKGIVLVQTLHTTTGLTMGGREPSCGFLVQENEPMLWRDFGEILNGGAERFLQLLPGLASGRERFLDFVPRGLLDKLLEIIITILRPSGYFRHDDFSIRTANISPGERKNAMAHLKAAMLREMVVLGFNDGKLILGKWQSILFWDFDPKGRDGRKISVVVTGNK